MNPTHLESSALNAQFKPHRVVKFGGSSVGRPVSLGRVLETIAREASAGTLAVVVSAMGDTTDWLIEATELAAAGDLPAAERIVDRIGDLAITNALVALRDVDSERAAGTVATITPTVRDLLNPLRQILLGIKLLQQMTAQSLDLVMSFGERISATVVTSLLVAHGVDAVFVDARTWTVTDDTFGLGRVDWERSRERVRELARGWAGRVPVCTGFLGATPDGRTTTLGRNGSDYTATLLARALEADEVVISTDVSGVMTADPNIVQDAYPVAALTYLEALELANYGAKMFHPRTMLPLIESGIPMVIRNTQRVGDAGTRISQARPKSQDAPVCVTSLEQLALITVRWRQLSQQVHMGQRVLSALQRAQITVWMATQAAHGQAVDVAVPQSQLDRARGAIEAELAVELGRREAEPMGVVHPVTLLSLVAEQMDEATNAAGRFLDTLGGVGINVMAIAQGRSSRSISCIIPATDTHIAVRTVHAAFNFAHQQVSLLVMGRGTVGAQLLDQLAHQSAHLRDAHDIALRVAGLSSSQRMLFADGGLDPATAADALEQAPASDADALTSALTRLSRMPVPVLVDCTAADDMEQVYAQAFALGIHVVAANKKPLAIAWSDRQALLQTARRNHRAYLYETTVGASLPVIDTLKNLVRTGDRVLKIEGAFSGTLGYLTNEVMRGAKLSEAVRRAKELGYTEPMPQDDLSGLDVARKALILARELGYEVELMDVEVEPLVPAAMIATPTPDALFAALEAHDAEFEAMLADKRAHGLTLRYLAIIQPDVESASGARVQVGPVFVPADHPATHLRGSEAFIAFTTQRYQDYPLIVRGSGAGGAVTAAGVLADILRIAQSVRGR
jgi:bifunctional aspartokinase / homoserine dehydrogenase 1